MIDQLRRAIAEHPGLVLEGEARFKFQREASSVGYLVKSVGLDTDTLTLCVFAMRKLGRFAEAHEAADRALRLGRSWQALTAKATVFRAQDDTDGAVALFAEAADVDPSDATACSEAAQTLGEAGRYAEASTWFGRAAERDPSRPELVAWREYAAFLTDQDPARAARVQALADAYPDDATIRFLAASARDSG